MLTYSKTSSKTAMNVTETPTCPAELERVKEALTDLLMGAHRLNQSQIVASVRGTPAVILSVLCEMTDDELVYVRCDPGCEPVYSANRL